MPETVFKSKGTSGIGYSITVAETDENGEYDGPFREYPHITDVVRLPSGKLQFHNEEGLKTYDSAQIVRATVEGVESASRYRCQGCNDPESDMITQQDWGERLERIPCPVCGGHHDRERMNIEDVRWDD